jgi:pyruvate dehydrogenase E2 component (dihydrolipoamide acetyltransferase)
MATILRMPEVLANASEAALQTWMVKEGDAIVIGQPIAEIETEKANVEYSSEVDGTMLKLLVAEGDSVVIGAPIGVIAAPGETGVDVDRLLAGAVDDPTNAIEASEDSGPAVASTVAPAAPHGERLFASPLVRRLAREQNLDLGSITGSGPSGRIVRRDLAAAVAPAPAASQAPTAPAQPAASSGNAVSAEFVDIPNTGMRRAIARRLTESKSTIPHFYVVADCRVDALLELRAKVNETATRKISVNDFVVIAVAKALIAVPEANAIWATDATRRFSGVDLAIAVSVDGGLLTPVLRGVEGMSLTAVSAAVADLAQRARDGKLNQHELEGGSFAISNLGMFGVDEFSAIINPPQSGILAVGAAKQRPVVQDGVLAVGTTMTVTLSADHRVIDGALGAQWLASFIGFIESPLSMLV